MTKATTNVADSRILGSRNSPDDRARWCMEMANRGSQPLDPNAINSLTIAVPGSSGDVALSTAIIRYVHSVNPKCHITFATKAAYLPLVRLCPGINETLEMPAIDFRKQSRRQILDQFAGSAERVICSITYPEDDDLLFRYPLIDAVWLLSGVSMEAFRNYPKRPWLESGAKTTIEQLLGGLRYRNGERPAIMKRLRSSLGRFRKRGRSFEAYYRHLVSETSRILWDFRLRCPGINSSVWSTAVKAARDHRLVILSIDAVTVPALPSHLYTGIVDMLRHAGWTVLQNVRDPKSCVNGALPYFLSYQEFLAARESGVPFIGLRSGLCDIASASETPLLTLYPAMANAWYNRPVTETYGLGSMGRDSCLDLECTSAPEDIAKQILDYLESFTRK